MSRDEFIDFYYENASWEQRFHLKTLLTSWGIQCFNAARKESFQTFEDYLKHLEDKNDSNN